MSGNAELLQIIDQDGWTDFEFALEDWMVVAGDPVGGKIWEYRQGPYISLARVGCRFKDGSCPAQMHAPFDRSDRDANLSSWLDGRGYICLAFFPGHDEGVVYCGKHPAIQELLAEIGR